jgi:V/A-type H+-transporting ATPase subunit C
MDYGNTNARIMGMKSRLFSRVLDKLIPMDYGYTNARIRGMKSRLFSRGALDDLIMRPDIDSLIIELEKTPYGDDIKEAISKYSGIYCVEYALRKNFARTFKKILGFVEGTKAERYIKIYLRRWDVQNVKTILRGKNVHTTAEEIMRCLAPNFDLDDAILGELIKQPDVRAVIDTMATLGIDYAKPLTLHFVEYKDEHDLTVLETALDKFYYEGAMDTVRGRSYDERFIRQILATEIDTINVKTVLRLVRDKIGIDQAKKFFLVGGAELDADDLAAMLETNSVAGVLEKLRDTSYIFPSTVPAEHLKKEKISTLEKLLDKYLIKIGVNAFKGDPLSIAIPIGYFWAKLNEVTNIRIIARCKTADISEEELREELFYV